MTFMLLQAFLLMAAAYFLGAFLGCWWRRTFYTPVEISAAEKTAPAVVYAPGDTAVRVPLAEPIPVQPRIEYVAPPDGMSDATRFERALSGAGTLTDRQSVASAETTVVSENEALEKAQIEDPPAPHSEVTAPPVVTEAASVLPPPDESAVRETDDAVAAAAAAAAAAMTIAARHRSHAEAQPLVPVEPPPPQRPPAQSPPQQLPLAGASAGASGVTAEVRTAPLVPSDRQDLKLIRGIDEQTERLLNSQGIWRYRDIANWRSVDVAAANRVFAAEHRVEHENWIEQAALLAGGALTDHARRRLRGETSSSKPTAKATPPRGPMHIVGNAPPQPRPAPAYVSPPPAAAASAAAAAIAAAAASASRGIAASGRPPHVPRPPAAKITPIAVQAPAPPAPTAAVTPPPPQAPETPTAPAAPAASGEPLQRIRGIDAAAERTLAEAGVATYSEIARWSSDEVKLIELMLDAPGRVSRENWIEQAQVLASGRSTFFARQRDTGTSGSAPGMASAAGAAAAAASAGGGQHGMRPSRLSDAIRDKQQRSGSIVRSDMAGLRSVRSEALKPNLGERTHMPGERTAAAIDDLKRIRGIGVLIEKKLNSLGVTAYDQIANWTVDDINSVSDALDFRGRIERENWVEQARILSAGGNTEFSRRVDRGELN
ncbi:MAG: hypothetical protein KDJ47_08980 [Hyphomicrobiaceae bacterium]|nr:hypothetical protein [Hyphomicrobiaceae bacterium]